MDKFLAKRILTYALRRGLAVAGAYFVAEGWVEGEVWTQVAPGLVLLAADFLMSIYDKYQARKAVQVAISLPPSANEADVRAAMKVT